MINSSPIDHHPAAQLPGLNFESTDASALVKQVRSHTDHLARSSPSLSRPFRSLDPSQSLLHFAKTLVTNTRLTTDQQSSLQSP
jgi:hypothetical protein